MFRAMALKEFRELRGIMLVSLIIYGGLLFWWISNFWKLDSAIPFVTGDYGGTSAFLAVGISVLLGLWQTLGESIRGTYPFLLHRPAKIKGLMGVKLLVGMSVYLIITGIPLWIYCLWAATPGTHASPFEWSMTVPAWVLLFSHTIVYLGAFLTGIMPSRWYGARCLPLAAAFLIFYVTAQLTLVFVGAWWLVGVTLVVDAWIIILILFVAQSRDYS